jgi:hypothetical protein
MGRDFRFAIESGGTFTDVSGLRRGFNVPPTRHNLKSAPRSLVSHSTLKTAR